MIRTMLMVGWLFVMNCRAQYSYNIKGNAGLVDGGFANVVAVSPNGVVLTGGNMCGIYRSTDNGATWAPASGGLYSPYQAGVAAIEFDKEDPNIVYAGLGFGVYNKPLTGLFVSTDSGISWSQLYNGYYIDFIGGNSMAQTGAADGFPQSTGRLIVSDSTSLGNFLYIGSFSKGLISVTNAPGSSTLHLTNLGIEGDFIRGLGFYRDSSGATLWVTTFNNGLWKGESTGANPITSVSRVSPMCGEEILVLDRNTMYFSRRNSNGILRTTDGGITFFSVTTTLPGGNSETENLYNALAGYKVGTNHVVYAGLYRADPSNGRINTSLVKTQAAQVGTPAWTYKFYYESSNPTDIIAGTNVAHWLLNDPDMSCRPGAANYQISQLVMGTNYSTIFACGHSGVYRSTDYGLSWEPASNGRFAHEIQDVAVDPNDSQRVLVSGADYGVYYSSNGLKTVVYVYPSSLFSSTRSVSWDYTRTPSRAIVVSGDHAADSGNEIYYSDDPASSTSWQSMHFYDQAGSPMAGTSNRFVACNFVKVATNKLVMVAVDSFGNPSKSGVWMTRNYGATWTRGTNDYGLMSGDSPWNAVGTEFIVVNYSIFIFDRENGLYRSRNAGDTWAKIWDITDTEGYYCGGLAGYSTNKLYLSANQKIYRLDNAPTGTAVSNGIDVVQLKQCSGTVGVIGTRPSDGALYAIENATTATQTNRLWCYHGTTWTDVANNWFRNGLPFSSGIFFPTNGSSIYIATRANGVMNGPLD